MKYNRRGTVLLATLILLAFLSLSIGLLQRRIFRLAQLRHEERIGDGFDRDAWGGIRAALLRVAKLKTECVTDKERESRLCMWRDPFLQTGSRPAILTPSTGYPISKLPLWNSANFNRDVFHCLELLPLPGELTPSALVSRRSCRALPTGSGDITLNGNLFVADRATLNKPRLSVSGAIKVASLSVQTASTLLAGGDILIDSLEAAAPILLVSATGDVVVQHFTGSPVVSAISPRAVYLPPEAIAASMGEYLPKTTPLIVLGRFEN